MTRLCLDPGATGRPAWLSILAAALGPLVVLIGDAALACPVCDTGTGAAVRAGIFDAHFATTAFGILSPIPVLLMIGAALHFGWTPARLLRRRRRPAELAIGEGHE
ncbi:MAG: hypothetical protein AB7V27_02355 [Candidatus Binatia bacterium]